MFIVKVNCKEFAKLNEPQKANKIRAICCNICKYKRKSSEIANDMKNINYTTRGFW